MITFVAFLCILSGFIWHLKCLARPLKIKKPYSWLSHVAMSSMLFASGSLLLFAQWTDTDFSTSLIAGFLIVYLVFFDAVYSARRFHQEDRSD